MSARLTLYGPTVTISICSYIDRHNERMWQDQYCRPLCVSGDFAKQKLQALPVIDYHLQQVDKRLADSRFLAGDAVSLVHVSGD